MEETRTPILKARIKELNYQVNQYSENPIIETFSFQGLTSSKKMYIIIPASVLVLLLIFQPTFIKSEIKNKNGSVLKLSFKKILISWLVISALLIVGLFASNYKS